jgi:hypothetical protein
MQENSKNSSRTLPIVHPLSDQKAIEHYDGDTNQADLLRASHREKKMINRLPRFAAQGGMPPSRLRFNMSGIPFSIHRRLRGALIPLRLA